MLIAGFFPMLSVVVSYLSCHDYDGTGFGLQLATNWAVNDLISKIVAIFFVLTLVSLILLNILQKLLLIKQVPFDSIPLNKAHGRMDSHAKYITAVSISIITAMAGEVSAPSIMA